MSSFKFVLRTDYKTKSGYHKIYLRYTHESKWFNIPTGQSVRSDDWNSELGEPRRSHPYKEELKNELRLVLDEAIKFKNKLVLQEKEVSVENLKNLYSNKKLNKKNKFSFEKAWEKHLNDRRNELKKSTITVYNSTLKHLNSFCLINSRKLDWRLFDSDFEHHWNNYFYENDISNGTSGKYFKTIKTFLNWAKDRKYLSNDSFSKYKVKQSEPEIHPLSEKEVYKIVEYISDHQNECTDTLRKVGNMFLFMCFSSLRFSDLQQLTFSMIRKGKNGFSDGFIRMDSQKTDSRMTIPLTSNIISEIRRIHILFNMYPYGAIYDSNFEESIPSKEPEHKVFPKISNQNFNKYIKELGKKAGLTRIVRDVLKIGNEKKTIHKELWETIGSHTGRRTFITLSLEKGMRPETIMTITGHKDPKTMYKYNKITSDVTVNETLISWDNLDETKQKTQTEQLLKDYSDELMKKLKKKNKPKNRGGDNGKKNPFTPPDWLK